MIIRFIVFILVIILVIFIGLSLVKELGDNRKNLEKQLRESALNNNEKTIWQKGPTKHRK